MYQRVDDAPAIFRILYIPALERLQEKLHVFTGDIGTAGLMHSDARCQIRLLMFQFFETSFGRRGIEPVFNSAQNISQRSIHRPALGLQRTQDRIFLQLTVVDLHCTVDQICKHMRLQYVAHRFAHNGNFKSRLPLAELAAGMLAFLTDAGIIIVCDSRFAGAAVSDHRAPAMTADQFACEKEFSHGTCPPPVRVLVLGDARIDPGKQIVRDQLRNDVREDDIVISVFSQVFAVAPYRAQG